METRVIAGETIWGKMNTLVLDNGLNFVKQNRFFVGDNFDLTGEDGNFILVQDLAAIQNAEVFAEGLDLVSKFANDGQQKKVLEVLKGLFYNQDKDSERYCTNVAFICDLGLWKNKKLCNKVLWHKSFPKYLSNNFWNYEGWLY